MRWYESNSNQKAIESWNKKLRDQSKHEKVMTANFRRHLFSYTRDWQGPH